MKVAIMQPYFMPYIGYFQLINAVDKFVLYDDVNYIKGGWINRNRILINGKANLITVPQLNASSNKYINEVGVNQKSKEYKNLLKTIETAYKKAPSFNEIFPLITEVLDKTYNSISDIAIDSVKTVASYLDCNTRFYVSSVDFPDTKGLERAERLIQICHKINGTTYINAIGGKELYCKENFKKSGIDLKFISSLPIQYSQGKNDFIPWLSIIDVLMWNSKVEVKEKLNKYELT